MVGLIGRGASLSPLDAGAVLNLDRPVSHVGLNDDGDMSLFLCRSVMLGVQIVKTRSWVQFSADIHQPGIQGSQHGFHSPCLVAT